MGPCCFIIHINSLFVVMSSEITIKDSASKTHVCMFCREQLKLSRLLRRKHKDETIVAEAMALKEGSKAFERIRLRGDYHHNCNVLALGEGELIVVRNPGSKQPFGDASSFLPCPDCLGFLKVPMKWKFFWRFSVAWYVYFSKLPKASNVRERKIRLFAA